MQATAIPFHRNAATGVQSLGGRVRLVFPVSRKCLRRTAALRYIVNVTVYY